MNLADEIVYDFWNQVLRGIVPFRKVSKEHADYTPTASDMNERCELCRYFEDPNKCRRVIGPVNRDGWCRYFERLKNGGEKSVPGE